MLYSNVIHFNYYFIFQFEFFCKICGKQFRTSGKARQHVVNVHKIQVKARFNATDITPEEQYWDRISNAPSLACSSNSGVVNISTISTPTVVNNTCHQNVHNESIVVSSANNNNSTTNTIIIQPVLPSHIFSVPGIEVAASGTASGTTSAASTSLPVNQHIIWAHHHQQSSSLSSEDKNFIQI